MISKIGNVNISNTDTRKNPHFGGLESIGTVLLNGATGAMQYCEANPMLNVAAADLTTAIIPRTIVETKTNKSAGFEAARRESSGLIINCIIPGFIVAGLAKVLQYPIVGKHSDMSKCWANEDTIKLVTDTWKDASDEAIIKNGKTIYAKGEKAKIYRTFETMLKNIIGVDGKALDVNFADEKYNFDESLKELTEKTFSEEKKYSWWAAHKAKSAKKASAKRAKIEFVEETPYSKIVNQTHVNKNIKINGASEYFSQDLESIVTEAPKILKEVTKKVKENPAIAISEIANKFAGRAKWLVTAKSLMGLGIVIPLAISAQPINRWITEKTSGKKGAPIYKDFEHSKEKVLSSKEKMELAKQKVISISTMIGVALLSIMKKPSFSMLKNITQFKGIFPTMDQARIISTATFASRMNSSEDKNDLREATVRDIATFSAFYFLGDFVAKGLATLMERTGKCKKEGISLINKLKKVPDNANIFTRLGYWIKQTSLKSTDEIYGKTSELTKYGKRMRALCQLGNLGFSLVALGLLIPIMNRRKTEKKHSQELAQQKLIPQMIT